MGGWSLRGTQMVYAKGEAQRGAIINLIKMAGHVSHPTRRARVTGYAGVHTKELVLIANLMASPDPMSQKKRGRSCNNTDPYPHPGEK